MLKIHRRFRKELRRSLQLCSVIIESLSPVAILPGSGFVLGRLIHLLSTDLVAQDYRNFWWLLLQHTEGIFFAIRCRVSVLFVDCRHLSLQSLLTVKLLDVCSI